MKNELIKNINKIHTTELGKERIKKNLKIENEPVEYCKEIIKKENSKITLKGKKLLHWKQRQNNNNKQT